MAKVKSSLTFYPTIKVTGRNLYKDGSEVLVNGVIRAGYYQTPNTVTFGDNIPDWKRKIRNNQSATTSLVGTNYEEVESLGDVITDYIRTDNVNLWEVLRYTRQYDMTPFSVHYYAPSATGLSSVSISDADNAAKADFLKHLIREQRQVSGGVILGELRETLRMLRNPARSLRRRVTDWQNSARKLRTRAQRSRRGSYAERKRALNKDLADSWLENSFGWQPLLSDIDDASRALNRRNEYVGDPQGVYGEGGRDTDLGTTVAYGNGQGCRIYHSFARKIVTHVEYYGHTRAYVLNPLRFNARLWGFSPQDFVPTLWELMPYSFLIDYFTNIGNVLEAWSWGRADLAWCEKRVLRQYTNTRTYWSVPSSAVYKDYGGSRNGGFRAASSYKTREPYSGSFLPSFDWNVPGMRSLKWLNIAALVFAKRQDRTFRL